MLGAGLIIACGIVYFATNSLMAVGVILTIAGIGFYIIEMFDRGIPVNTDINLVPTGSEDILKNFQLPLFPGGLREVFFIAGDRYTYDEAPAVCAVYGAELASYDQVAEAYAKGAEWCGYGWTQGSMALFPTQESTWKKYQNELDHMKKTRCGRPGINGGYFNPKMRFGVNCYGMKPGCDNKKYPIPVDDGLNKDLVRKFTENSGSIRVDPFNRNGWSMWGMLA